jgi:hypothetical protein
MSPQLSRLKIEDLATTNKAASTSHRLSPIASLTQFKEAIELMKSGNSGKIVLDWSKS